MNCDHAKDGNFAASLLDQFSRLQYAVQIKERQVYSDNNYTESSFILVAHDKGTDSSQGAIRAAAVTNFVNV